MCEDDTLELSKPVDSRSRRREWRNRYPGLRRHRSRERWYPTDEPAQHDQASLSCAAKAVELELQHVRLPGLLTLPPQASGLVVFAHGSGSSRLSPRNQLVAQALQQANLGTLLFDLLTETEEQEDQATRRHRFDIDLLSGRLVDATAWLAHQPDTENLRYGYFGASTGAAAAIRAAAESEWGVEAIVSRGGRPDLAGPALVSVTAPTLLIVGGADIEVLRLNEQAMAQMHTRVGLEIIPGATHLFEEPGALQQVAKLAQRWFTRYLMG
ncbi:MAG: dienelactone hydrolase family protein [Pseudomonadota bacterium]|nr:dienelactone hydrolase family protein [Pseudomonadota bacterium]